MVSVRSWEEQEFLSRPSLRIQAECGLLTRTCGTAERDIVDHGFEIAVDAEDHAPLMEQAHGAAARDLHASLGTDVGLAA